MTYAIPQLSALVERARRSFRANLPGTDAWLWPNNIAVSAKVFGGLLFEAFGFADYIRRQIFVSTSDGEHLDIHGPELGLARRPAQPATGSIDVVAAAAVTIDAGAVFARSDGVQYAALNPAALVSAGTVSVAVVSVIDGKSTIAAPGTPLTPVSGVTSTDAVTATVDSLGLGEGADVEPDGPFYSTDLATYRGRILFRKRNPPHGGSAADYVMWASQYPGVTRVFVERLWQGPGTVRVFPIMDDLYVNGIPPAGQIAAIAAAIEPSRPAGAGLTVAAATPQAVNVTVSGLSPDNAEMRAAVVSELRKTFLTKGRVAGVDSPNSAMPYLATPFVFSRSWLWQAVANTSGEEKHAITAPTSDPAMSAGSVPILGTVTFAP